MAGSEEKDGVRNPNPSPGTSVSNFLDDEFGATSFSDLLAGNVTEVPDPESEMKKSVSSAKEEDGVGIQISGDDSFLKNSFSSQKSNLNAGLTERIAARTGFNAPKLNTTQIRSENMMTPSSGMCSPYLTIPHCLDSPVFLSNSMALPSPTTGKFLFGKSKERPFDDVGPESFVFKPYTESDFLCFSNLENKGLSAIEHPQQKFSIQSEHPTQKGNVQSGSVKFHHQQELNIHAHFSDSYEKKDVGADITINPRTSDSFMENKYSPPLDDQPDGVAEPIGEFSSVAASTPADDGYNWRKYGQKQVKGSEYPRSYYKCTHPSCHVRKKVERSHEGHITEIIYRGTHVHPKPSLNRRSSVSHPFGDPQFDGSEYPGSEQGFEEGPLEAFTQNGNLGDWRNDSLRVPSYASGAVEFCDPSSPLQTHDGSFVESPDPVDVSSTLSNAEDEDDGATHGSVSLGCEGEEDETESKRRKSENCSVELSAASRAAREPKVVVQTTSEVDILDDGYRWRKYGQKVVKGNPNPRSYYKCTSQGCKVRKHVERASHDLKSVITTYEGKHNHEVPAARNSNCNHAQQSTMSVPQVHGHNWRPEPNQDNFMKFDVHMAPQGAFALHGREERGPSASFGFGMPQQGFGITGMSSMAPMKSVDFPPAYLFMGGHRRAAEAAYMMPKGEMKVESFREPGSKEAPVHHQMMGRFPLGP